MQYEWAVPGQEVVCVTDTWTDQSPGGTPLPSSFPQFMQQYTIQETADIKCSLFCPGHIMICLKEFPDYFWEIQAFEPVQKVEDFHVNKQREPEPV